MFERKGIQYDVSRGRVPTIETIRRHVADLKPLGLDTVVYYMECVVKCDTFPGVGCGETPITKDYLRELNAVCREAGVSLVPLFQVMGHQERLLALEEYAHLGALPHEKSRNAGFNHFDPANPETLATVIQWLEELVPLFDSPVVHIGCDEVYFFHQENNREVLEEKGEIALVGEYITAIRDALARIGKRPAMWSDLIINRPELIDRIPQDVILTNWTYGTLDGVYERENGHFAAHEHLASRGHELWCFGNTQAEYLFIPFRRLEENTRIWMDLTRKHGGTGYIVTDWGDQENVHPLSLAKMGAFYSLKRVADETYDLDSFLADWSAFVLGRRDGDFEKAIRLLLLMQGNPEWFTGPMQPWSPQFRSMYLDDPAGTNSMARRFSFFPKETLDAMLADAREAYELLDGVAADGAPRPDDLEDMKMLANRVLAMTLRLQLWYVYNWDTGYIAPRPEHDRAQAALLKEYLDRTARDLDWHERRWRGTALESELARSLAMLGQAREAVKRLFPRRMAVLEAAAATG